MTLSSLYSTIQSRWTVCKRLPLAQYNARVTTPIDRDGRDVAVFIAGVERYDALTEQLPLMMYQPLRGRRRCD